MLKGLEDVSSVEDVCEVLNSRVNYNRSYWTEHFSNLLKGGDYYA